MTGKEYLESIRIRLHDVPIEERQTWSTPEFVAWLLKEKYRDNHLFWEREPDDSWLRIQSACGDLIGPKAGSRERAELVR